ncbi:MAG TPA: long-chain fatty acid--CoA ligase [Thermoanaerobaculia bacterium]|nr:long-chain fatty acid--CoA ligase [Thermoanaerobaculia bacterium]
MAVETLNEILLHTLALPREAAMMVKRGGEWRTITVPEFAGSVRHLSAALRGMGVRKDERVAILSENRPEWTIADMAILAAGAVTVPVYSTLLGRQVEFILNDSGAAVVFVSNREQLGKMKEIGRHCPALRVIVMFDGEGAEGPQVRSYEAVLEEGRAIEDREPGRFEALLRERRPDDLATIVYTSGTTGNPKGAMLTHGNVTSNIKASIDPFRIEPGLIALNILPLSHILERMVDFAYLYKGATIAYAEDVTRVADNLLELRPHFFAAVPRLFEKMQGRILETVSQAPALRQKIFHWALGVGKERLPYRVEGKPMPPGLKLKSAIADRLVFRKITEKLGGRIRFIISGGAPLSAEIAAFFIGAGIDIYEGYGLTETSPVIAVNTPQARRIGTVGRPVPGVEVRIAEDGEILTRGPHVMRGYFNNDEATEKAIDRDGWFHTGDIGVLDEDGFLRITDRKKDIIVNAYGKNIAPQPLENLLKSSPLIATPVLLGDRRKFIAALIVPDFEHLEREAASMGLRFDSRDEMVRDERIRALVQKEIDRFNENLDRQEQIRKFVLLPRDFSIEEDEITPSLKVKRKKIDEKYRALIDALYEDEPAGVPE